MFSSRLVACVTLVLALGLFLTESPAQAHGPRAFVAVRRPVVAFRAAPVVAFRAPARFYAPPAAFFAPQAAFVAPQYYVAPSAAFVAPQYQFQAFSSSGGCGSFLVY